MSPHPNDVRTLLLRHHNGRCVEYTGIILSRFSPFVAALYWTGEEWRQVVMPEKNIGERTTLTAEQAAALPKEEP